MANIISAEATDGYMVFVKFEDGKSGFFDMHETVTNGINLMGQLRDTQLFSKVFVDKDLGTIAWPNGVDVCPDLIKKNLISPPE